MYCRAHVSCFSYISWVCQWAWNYVPAGCLFFMCCRQGYSFLPFNFPIGVDAFYQNGLFVFYWCKAFPEIGFLFFGVEPKAVTFDVKRIVYIVSCRGYPTIVRWHSGRYWTPRQDDEPMPLSAASSIHFRVEKVSG